MPLEKQRRDWLYNFLNVLPAFLILLPLLWYGMAEDQGLFSCCVWAWRAYGLKPYVDIFVADFPGIFILHYVIQAVLGESVTAFRIFDLAWQAATALMVYLISVKIFKNRISGVLGSAFYAISYLDLGAWNTGERDGFFLLFYLLSLWLCIQEKSKPWETIRPAAAGFFMGCAFLIKPYSALTALIFLGLIARTQKRRLLSLLEYIAAGSIPIIAILVYFWRIRALRIFLWDIFSFATKVYTNVLVFNLKRTIYGVSMENYLISNIFILSGALLLIVFRKKTSDETRTYILWLLLIFLGSYLTYLAQAKYFLYHQAPVWGTMSLLAGGGWALAFERMLAKWPQVNKALVSVLASLLILSSILLIKDYNRTYLLKALRTSPAKGQHFYPFYDLCDQAAKYVQNHSGPEDRLQVWGGETIINYLSRRKPASRFPYTLYFIFEPEAGSPSPMQRELGLELLADLKKEPPLYFAVELLPQPVFGIASEKAVLVQDYPEIWKFIAERYVKEETMAFIEIYRRKQ
jgi:hypothetical protein